MPTQKEILNSLRCPICQSQIDGVSYSIRFYCAQDQKHYNVWIKDGKLKKETINLYDLKKLLKYELTQTYETNGVKTIIILENIDAEGREIFSFEENSYTANLALFDFRNFNYDKAINKIKTFLVFG